jgi:hypothetical protein
MKQENHLYKIRIIQHNKIGGTTTWGVTVPYSFKNWFDTTVSIKESGICLILESGAKPIAFTSKEIKTQGEVIDKIRL